MLACKYFISAFLLFIFFQSKGQDSLIVSTGSDYPSKINYSLPQKYSVLGMNMTYLITTLVPLGNNEGNGGPYSFSFKRYGKKAAFRLNLGLNAGVLSEADETDNWGMALSFGFERRRQVYKKFGFYAGMDIGAILGDWRIPFSAQGDSEENLSIGGGPVFGVSYDINKHLYIAMETTIFLGYGEDDFSDFGFTARVIPPVGIFLNLRL